MDDQTKQKLLQIPKSYTDVTLIGHNEECFTLVLVCGTNATSFALSPKHAKRILKSLTEQVDKYEKSFDEIVGEWNIPSPIQSSDLSPSNKPPEGGDQKKK